MAHKPFVKVPLPTEEDMKLALAKEREIVGLSAKNKEQWLFLKLAFRTGDIATVYVYPHQADSLFRALREFLPNRGENDGSPLKWASEGLEVQEGEMPAEPRF